MPNTPESWEAVGVAGALVQSYAQGQKDFLPSLAVLLEQAMPDVTTIVRKPVRLFSPDKRIESVTVNLGDNVYTLIDRGANTPIEAKRAKVVRGITLKSDPLPIKEWLHEVGAEVSSRAEESQEALAALRNFMEIKSI
jgi:hypothetical protein